MAGRKKIAYVITKSNWGGAQRYVYDLATHLAPEQFEVLAACGGNGELVWKLRRAGIRVFPIPPLDRDVRFGRDLASLWSLIKFFMRERPDIVHLNSPKAGGLGAVAAFAAKLLTFNFSLLTVFTVHGWPFGEDRPHWQRGMIFFFSWLSTLFQNRIIVIQNADYRTARRFIPQRKLALVPHGIAAVDFAPRRVAREFFASTIGCPLDPATILAGACGELTKNKGLPYLIEAARLLKSRFPNFIFHILVIGEGEDREKLQRHTRMLGLADTVFLTGFIPDAHRFFRGLDLFVLPSLKEGLPYALMEAMMAGLAVIATNVGGIPDLVENGANGLLVKPKDPESLAQAMQEIFQHPALAAALGRAARTAMEKRFRFETMLKNTSALYRNRLPAT